MSRSRRVLVLLVVLVAAFLAWPYLPLTNSNALGRSDGAAAVRAQVEAVRRSTRAAAEALTDVERFSSELGQARTAVPLEPSLVELIDMLDAAASAAQLEWRAGSPSPVPLSNFESSSAVPPNADIWQITMSVSGTTDGVGRVLDSLRRLDRLVTVVSVSIQPGDGVVNGELVLRYYTSAGDPAAIEAEQEPAEDGLKADQPPSQAAPTGEDFNDE